MTRFQKLALAAVVGTFLLIGIGGFVRAAGAGLGCPDWPRCFGRWFPPLDSSQLPPGIDPARFNFALAWTEYLNRLAGVLVGFLILGTALLAVWDHRRQPRILWPALASLLLVGFQGWFGGQVVRRGLDPRFVSVHLFLALGMAALLLWVLLDSSLPRPLPAARLPSPRRRFLGLARLAVAVDLVQVGLGALLRGSIDQAIAQRPDLARELLLGQVGGWDPVHRSAGLLVLLACAGLVWSSRELAPASPLRRLALVAGLLALAQASAGTGLAYLGLPPLFQLFHVFFSGLLLGSLLVVALLANRLHELPGEAAAPCA